MHSKNRIKIQCHCGQLKLSASWALGELLLQPHQPITTAACLQMTKQSSYPGKPGRKWRHIIHLCLQQLAIHMLDTATQSKRLLTFTPLCGINWGDLDRPCLILPEEQNMSLQMDLKRLHIWQSKVCLGISPSNERWSIRITLLWLFPHSLLDLVHTSGFIILDQLMGACVDMLLGCSENNKTHQDVTCCCTWNTTSIRETESSV